MAEMKYLNTRVQLKYDSYENWTKAENQKDLLPGEIAIAYLGPTQTTTTPDNGTHPVLFKVGPGKFNALPWASALAADVYAWAKQENLPIVRNDEEGKAAGNVISSISWNEEGKIEYTTASVATSEGMAALQEALEAVQKDIADNRDDWAEKTVDTNTDTQYRFDTNGDKLVVYKTLYTLGTPSTEEKVGEYEFLTAEEVATTLESYYTKTEADVLINAAAAKGQQGIDDAATALAKANEKTTMAEVEAKDYATKAEAQSYANAKDGAIQQAQKTADDVTAAFNAFITGTEDTTEVIDTLKEIQEFMTEETGAFVQLSGRVSTLEGKPGLDKVGTVTSVTAGEGLAGGTITETGTISLSEATRASLAKADSALQEHQDISGKADKVTGATAGNFAGLDANGNLVDSGKKASDFAPAGNYKTIQTPVADPIAPADDEGNPEGRTEFISSITQNENGEITVTKHSLPMAAIAGDISAGDNSIFVDLGWSGTDFTDYSISVAEQGITSDKIANHAVSAHHTKACQDYTGEDAEVWVFCCGSSTTLI